MNYKYRFIKAVGGIYIELDYDILQKLDNVDDYTEISRNIYLKIEQYLPKEAIYFIEKGIFDIRNLINQSIDNDIFIVIKKITLSFSDYQDEGMYCAIQQALSQHFGFKATEMNISYDDEKRKFIFKFPDGKILE